MDEQQTGQFELAQDQIETLLLLLLENQSPQRRKWQETDLCFGQESGRWNLIDASDEWLSKYTATPAVAFVPTGEDRLYTFNHRDLTAKPWDILGSRTEVVLPKWESNEIWWTCMERIKSPPRGVSTWGKAAAWYIRHVRVADTASGWKWYRKRAVPFSPSGSPLPVRYSGTRPGDGPSDDGTFAVGDCSIVEDALRANSVRADVSAGCSISFALDEDAYQDFFRLRDGPRETASGRRNPIIHWVGRHLRRMKSGRVTEVKSHARGTPEIDVGGISARLTLQSGPYAWTKPAA